MNASRRRPEHLQIVRDLPDVAGVPPPHDLDAEAAVLSAVMLDRGALDRVLEILKPEHFYSTPNARIYQAVQQLAIEQTPIDIVTVATWLRDRGWLEKVDGTRYLAQLADATPAVGNVMAHARTVFRKWRRRSLIAMCQVIAAEARAPLDDEQTEDAMIDGAPSRVLEAIGRDPEARGTIRLRDALRVTMAQADVRPGDRRGYATGLPSFDRATGGLLPKESLLLKAPRKTGKSVLSGQIAGFVSKGARRTRTPSARCRDCGSEACEAHSWRRQGALIIQLEGDESDVSTRLACAHGRIDWNEIQTGQAGQHVLRQLASSSEAIADWPIIIDDRKDLTIAKLGLRVRAARDELAREGVDLVLVVLDNIQLWPGDGPHDRRDRKQVVQDASCGIKDLKSAPDLGLVSWILVSQVNAEGVARDAGAAIEADVDVITSLHVEDTEDPALGALPARWTIEERRRGGRARVPLWFYSRWTLFWDGG